MPDFLTLDDLRVNHKIVLVRADLNVPMKEGHVTDTTRLERLLPTLKELASAGARVVVLSHFGRPDGKKDPRYTLRPVATELSRLYGQPIAFAEDCVGDVARGAVDVLKPGHILVLENTRFYPGEEGNDPAFAAQLAGLGDLYVNDAFSAAHRAHASTAGIAQHMPSAAGRQMQAELVALARVLEHPEKPVAALVGGSKISTKLDLLGNLIRKVGVLVLGGGMANTFLAAQGRSIGKSLVEPDMLDTARMIMKEAEQHGCHILLPQDVVVAAEMKKDAPSQIVPVSAVPPDQMILDLGPKTVMEIRENLAMCRTLVWNGPLGVFEVPPFDRATNEVVIAVADLTKRGKLLSVGGGGDTVAAVANAGGTHGFSYLSTAGGAFLEWLEGKDLPGVIALKKAMPAAKKGRAIL